MRTSTVPPQGKNKSNSNKLTKGVTKPKPRWEGAHAVLPVDARLFYRAVI